MKFLGDLIGGLVGGAIGLAIIYFGFIFYFGAAAPKAKVGNITENNKRISATVINQSGKDHEFVAYIKQNNLELCPVIFTLKSSERRNINFRCPELSVGKFSLVTGSATVNSQADFADPL